MRFRSFLCGLLSAGLVLSSFSAQAAMIDSTALLSGAERQAAEKRVETFLARGDVQEQLEALGVDSAQAAERVALMTDAEIQDLSTRLEELPAGAGALELVLIIVLLLIVLELLGAINIFSKI